MIQPVINNYEALKDCLYVLNPADNKFVKAEEWIKTDNPSIAQLVAVKTPYYLIVFSKNFVHDKEGNPVNLNFEDVQKACAEFSVPGCSLTFRAPRRNESNYIYDAWWAGGLKELIEKIDGDDFEVRWWTCEKDSWSCSRGNASYAWFFYGLGGYAYSYGVGISFRALPVVLLDVNEVNN